VKGSGHAVAWGSASTERWEQAWKAITKVCKSHVHAHFLVLASPILGCRRPSVPVLRLPRISIREHAVLLSALHSASVLALSLPGAGVGVQWNERAFVSMRKVEAELRRPLHGSAGPGGGAGGLRVRHPHHQPLHGDASEIYAEVSTSTCLHDTWTWHLAPGTWHRQLDLACAALST